MTLKRDFNGIILEANTYYKLKKLENALKQLKFKLNPNWITKIKLADTEGDCSGMFFYASKMIKINQSKRWKNKWGKNDFDLTLIHEYIHALDNSNNQIVSKLFLKEYSKALHYVYQKTNQDVFKTNRVSLEYRPSIRLNGKYDDILLKKGYGYDYCLTDVFEFACVSMELYYSSYPLNNSIKRICKRIEKKWLK